MPAEEAASLARNICKLSNTNPVHTTSTAKTKPHSSIEDKSSIAKEKRVLNLISNHSIHPNLDMRGTHKAPRNSAATTRDGAPKKNFAIVSIILKEYFKPWLAYIKFNTKFVCRVYFVYMYLTTSIDEHIRKQKFVIFNSFEIQRVTLCETLLIKMNIRCGTH